MAPGFGAGNCRDTRPAIYVSVKYFRRGCDGEYMLFGNNCRSIVWLAVTLCVALPQGNRSNHLTTETATVRLAKSSMPTLP